MGFKDGYDPSITQGIQRFVHNGSWATVCYWGAVLKQYSYGDRLFFQNQYGTYWLGKVEHDSFMFIIETPLDSVLEGLRYLESEDHVKQLHDVDGWFCEQVELPF